MFKRIAIELAGPICTCTKQNLSWGIWLNEKARPGLKIECEECNVQLIIPATKFVATWRLDAPYPDDREKKPGTLSLVQKE